MKLSFAVIVVSALVFMCAQISTGITREEFQALTSRKTSWPELVGKTGEEAKAQILQDRPGSHVEIINDDDPWPADDSPTLVVISVNDEGIVSYTPRIGAEIDLTGITWEEYQALLSVKTSWPELVGKTGEEAKAQILQDRPDIQVELLNVRDPVSEDYVYIPNLLRVPVDDEGIVAYTPRLW